MQFAERWLGITSLCVAFGATIGLVARPHHHHRHHPHHAYFDPGMPQCRDFVHKRIETPPPPPSRNPAEVLGHANVAHCLDHSNQLDLLINIGTDGHVTRVSNRPDPETTESRCIADELAKLQFADATSPVTIRYMFTKGTVTN